MLPCSTAILGAFNWNFDRRRLAFDVGRTSLRLGSESSRGTSSEPMFPLAAVARTVCSDVMVCAFDLEQTCGSLFIHYAMPKVVYQIPVVNC